MKRMWSVVLCALVPLSGLIGGCATIVNGRTQDVSFTSNPPGAVATVDTGEMCTTPGRVNLRRNKDYVVTISKEGYQPQVVSLNSVLSGWIAGNLLFGGIIGGAVDAGTGAAWTITPEKVNVTLVPLAPGQAPAAAPAGPLTIEDRLRITEEMHKSGTMNDAEYQAVKKRLTEEQEKARKAAEKPAQG